MARQYDTNTTADDLLKDLSGEIKGKIILTTGVSPGGLGSSFVESIAKAEPELLILASRNVSKTQVTAEIITDAHPSTKVRVLQLDLGSLAAVREAAATVNSWSDVPNVDVLVNNAALMAVDYAVTSDGFESQFGTNHLGHFLFTNLILDKILASKTPRIVSVSSSGHRVNPIRFGDHGFRVSSPSSLMVRQLTGGRMARATTGGMRTASPKPRICSSRSLSPRSWADVACKHTVCTPAPSPGLVSPSTLTLRLSFRILVSILSVLPASMG